MDDSFFGGFIQGGGEILEEHGSLLGVSGADGCEEFFL